MNYCVILGILEWYLLLLIPVFCRLLSFLPFICSAHLENNTFTVTEEHHKLCNPQVWIPSHFVYTRNYCPNSLHHCYFSNCWNPCAWFVVTEIGALFIKQSCATEMPPSLGQGSQTDNVLCAAHSFSKYVRDAGEQCFPLQRPKKLLLTCSLCVCVCESVCKLQVLEQNKLNLRAEQTSVQY